MRLRVLRYAAACASVVLAAAACSSSSSSPSRAGTVSVVQLTGERGSDMVGGSGTLVDAGQRLVVTTSRVVAGVTGLEARIAGGKTGARVVATAPCDDMALVKLDRLPKGASAVAFGNSRKVKVGDKVTAVGFPEAFVATGPEDEDWAVQPGPPRVATGAITVANLAVEPDNSVPHLADAIQHSAVVNQGDAGGPLLDPSGDLIGVTDIGYEHTGEMRIQGQGFAIGADHVRSLLATLRGGHSVANAGWSIGPFAKLSLSAVFKRTGYAPSDVGISMDRLLGRSGVDGVFVYGVDEGSAAGNAGMTGGDLVTAINGTPVRTVEDVCKLLRPAVEGAANLKVDGYRLTQAPPEDGTLPPPKTWTVALV